MMRMCEWWEWLLSKKTLIGLILGQFVSLLITSTGFSSSQLSRRGINAPTSQSFLNYLLLAIFYGGILLHRRRWLQMKWYYYVMLAIVDVEANYLGGSNPLKGDLLVVAGSMLYAVSNVSEEFLVKEGNRIELMAMLGFFGALISGCQMYPYISNVGETSLGFDLRSLLISPIKFLYHSDMWISHVEPFHCLTSDMWAVLVASLLTTKRLTGCTSSLLQQWHLAFMYTACRAGYLRDRGRLVLVSSSRHAVVESVQDCVFRSVSMQIDSMSSVSDRVLTLWKWCQNYGAEFNKLSMHQDSVKTLIPGTSQQFIILGHLLLAVCILIVSESMAVWTKVHRQTDSSVDQATSAAFGKEMPPNVDVNCCVKTWSSILQLIEGTICRGN
ncbi:hypothetical protein HPP92_008987 [Vanilla planifolia]|uniref:Uncharacterized protein n=1 Tax=Vanilla planifolia TaxID=51239 RepID=A0A835RED8_VANPL|nr:hypothetical protein HPP92_008987 [Vanilla planifolia]